MIPVPNVTWELQAIEVQPRSAYPLLVTQRRKLLVCQCMQLKEAETKHRTKLAEVLPLFDTDHCGDIGIEHLIIHPDEQLPVLLINYSNRALVVAAALRCFDITDMPFNKATALYAAWLRIRKEN